jgi:hypothetical protein
MPLFFAILISIIPASFNSDFEKTSAVSNEFYPSDLTLNRWLIYLNFHIVVISNSIDILLMYQNGFLAS